MGSTPDGTPSPPGRIIADRYELRAPLGTGGMAQVWSATDLLLSRPVAVKLLHRHLADDPAFVQRFRREAVAVARLTHPNIVAVYDTISTDEFEAIVMELVGGTTLREHLDQHGPLPAQEVRRLGIELAGALDCAHRNGIVHRDIKPANILISEDGSARLTDFGIAKADEDPDLTVAGTLVGTAAYLAPEQVGVGKVDQRTDLYSLATVLYEALSGSIPFRGDSPAATALARLHHEPADLADLVPAEAALAGVIMTNLARSADQRYQTALEFGTALAESTSTRRPSRRAAIAAVRGEVGPTEPPPPHPRPQRSMVGRGLLVLLIAGPVALIGALVASSGGDGSSTSTTTTPVAAVAVDRASSFDPLGDNSAENEAQAPNAVDDDPTTSWSTESYDAQDFGTKPGVGLVLHLKARTSVASLRLEASTGWTGRVVVTDDDPTTTTEPPTGPSTALRMESSPLDVDLGGRVGRFVVIWITDLGPAAGRHRVTIAEAAVTGRAR